MGGCTKGRAGVHLVRVETDRGEEREGAGREVEVRTAGRMNHTELYIAEFLLLLRDAILRCHLTEDKDLILLLLTNIIRFVYIN